MIRSVLILILFLFMKTPSSGVEMPASAKAYYEHATVGLGFLSPEKGVEQFVQFVVENWEAVARDFRSFAPDPRRRALAAIAAEGLAPRDYVRFVSIVCDQVATDQVSPDLVETFLFSEGRKSGFFAVNYDASEVKTVTAKFKQLVPPEEGDLRSFLNQIESGEAKKTFLMWQKAENGPAPELLGVDVPQAGGSANKVATRPILSPSAPVSGETPTASPQRATPTAPTFGTAAAGHATVWPWLVGIAALIGIVALVFRHCA